MIRRSNRWSKSRKPFRRRFSRGRTGFARKKYDVITLFNNLHAWSSAPEDVACGPEIIQPCGHSTSDCGPDNDQPQSHCCDNFALFQLVSNGVLESFFQDHVTVVRIFGDLYYQTLLQFPVGLSLCESVTANPQTALDMDQYVVRYMEQITWGLRKYNITMDPAEQTAGNGDTASPQFVYDSTETPWIWQRNKVWRPREEHSDSFHACSSLLGFRDGTSQNGYTVPPGTSGTISTYNVPAETSPGVAVQVPCDEFCTDRTRATVAAAPPLHHWRFNVRKHITLRGADALHLGCFVRHPAAPGNTLGWNCNPTFINEGWTGNVYLRVRAVVRLN